MKMRQKQLGLLVVGLLAAPSIAIARAHRPQLAEKVRSAQVIAVGSVKELGDDYISVAIEKVIKGSISSGEMELGWKKTGNHEDFPARHNLNDRILIFAIKNPRRYEPIFGAQGTLKIESPVLEGQLESTIMKIRSYDAATSTEQRHIALESMLEEDNAISQQVILWELYMALSAYKSGVVTPELVPRIIQLTKSSDRTVPVLATHVLGWVADKNAIPVLIDLVGSPSGPVSEAASLALRRRTGYNLIARLQQPPEERKMIWEAWVDWWAKNKSTVTLQGL